MRTDPEGFVFSPGGSCLDPLDAALAYIRERPGRVLPLYLLAMAPASAAVFFLIDAVSSGHRSALAAGCGMLTLAAVWRWGALAAVQRRVQEDLRGEPPLALRRRLGGILLVRLFCAVAITWGAFAILPAIYGMFLSAFAPPLLLEREAPAGPQVKKALAWIHGALARLGRTATALAAAAGLVAAGVLALQFLVAGTLLPSWLGLETPDLALTLASGAWWMSLAYLLFLVFDFYWTVASVMVFYDLQARRLGTDLRLRLRKLCEAGT